MKDVSAASAVIGRTRVRGKNGQVILRYGTRTQKRHERASSAEKDGRMEGYSETSDSTGLLYPSVSLCLAIIVKSLPRV
jgi:hypothetical protein